MRGLHPLQLRGNEIGKRRGLSRHHVDVQGHVFGRGRQPAFFGVKQLLDYDAKRMHYFERLFHAEEDWLSATSENMALHVDMAARKTVPFPENIAARLAKMKAAHAALPVPEAAGRRIAMPGK